MSELLFALNDRATLEAKQTTAQLMWAAHRRGLRVWAADANAWGRTPDGVEVSAVDVPPSTPDLDAMVSALATSTPQRRLSRGLDAVWVRTNPGRATHDHAPLLQLLHQVEDEGVVVRSRPGGLQRSASKLYLGSLPVETLPRTFVCTDAARMREALAELGGSGVVKPALGTRGEGVQRLDLGQTDLEERLAEAEASGAHLVQALAPEADLGDVRVHVVDGQLLECDGAAAVIARRPGPGEWRSNVALGGRPTRAVATPRIRQVVALVGPVLRAHGLWHAGLDLVGGLVVECNVFSPGGLQDAGHFAGVDFHEALLDRFLDGLSPAAAD